LLDILLSGMDGFEILKRIKEDEKTRHIPVILLSNLGQKEDIEKGKALGAARFLVKAMVTLDEIIEEMKAVLKEEKK
jgi:CheY-like chemotaxis protein